MPSCGAPKTRLWPPGPSWPQPANRGPRLRRRPHTGHQGREWGPLEGAAPLLRQLPPDVGRIVATGSRAPCQAGRARTAGGRQPGGGLSKRTDPWGPPAAGDVSFPSSEASVAHSGPGSVPITCVSPSCARGQHRAGRCDTGSHRVMAFPSPKLWVKSLLPAPHGSRNIPVPHPHLYLNAMLVTRTLLWPFFFFFHKTSALGIGWQSENSFFPVLFSLLKCVFCSAGCREKLRGEE